MEYLSCMATGRPTKHKEEYNPACVFIGFDSQRHPCYNTIMARKTAHTICSSCRQTFIGTGSLCSACAQKSPRTADARQSPGDRGYGYKWHKIREQVLKEYSIPREQWSLYAVDHNPPYNPEVEPDHTKYDLVPRLIDEHNRKTATQDTSRDHKGRFIGSMGRG